MQPAAGLRRGASAAAKQRLPCIRCAPGCPGNGGSDEIHPRHRFLPLLPAGCSHPEACAAAWASPSPQLSERRFVGAFMAGRHPPKPRLALQPVRPGCPERGDYPAAEPDETTAAPRRATSEPWSGGRALQLQSQTGVPGAGLLHAHRLPAALTPRTAAFGSPASPDDARLGIGPAVSGATSWNCRLPRPQIMPTRPPRIQHAEYRDAGPRGPAPCDCRCSNA